MAVLSCECQGRSISSDYWEGNSRFGFELLHEMLQLQEDNINEGVERESENIVISPFSISSAISLAYAGSPPDSTTSKQIAQTLYYPTCTQQFQNPIDLTQHIIDEQNDLCGSNNKFKDVSIAIANRVYLNQDYKMNDNIINLLGKDHFESINFGQNEKAIDKINDWIAKQTNDKIKNILSPSAVTQNTFAVLINVCTL